MKILTRKHLERKNFQRFTYPKDMDEEMVDLMDVLNNVPGCRTLYCCCGHGSDSWYFVVACTSADSAHAISSWFEKNGCEVMHGKMSFVKIPEHELSIYNKKMGTLPVKARKAEYLKMCEHFLDYVPRKHW